MARLRGWSTDGQRTIDKKETEEEERILKMLDSGDFRKNTISKNLDTGEYFDGDGNLIKSDDIRH